MSNKNPKIQSNCPYCSSTNCSLGLIDFVGKKKKNPKPPVYNPLAMSQQSYANQYGKKMKAYNKKVEKCQIEENRKNI